jgi:hypothetical protein
MKGQYLAFLNHGYHTACIDLKLTFLASIDEIAASTCYVYIAVGIGQVLDHYRLADGTSAAAATFPDSGGSSVLVLQAHILCNPSHPGGRASTSKLGNLFRSSAEQPGGKEMPRVRPAPANRTGRGLAGNEELASKGQTPNIEYPSIEQG